MSDLQAPANGTDQRLDLVLTELKAIKKLLTPEKPAEPADGETIQIKEPTAKPADKAKAAR